MRIFSLKKPKNKNPIFNGLIKIIRKLNKTLFIPQLTYLEFRLDYRGSNNVMPNSHKYKNSKNLMTRIIISYQNLIY